MSIHTAEHSDNGDEVKASITELLNRSRRSSQAVAKPVEGEQELDAPKSDQGEQDKSVSLDLNASDMVQFADGPQKEQDGENKQGHASFSLSKSMDIEHAAD